MPPTKKKATTKVKANPLGIREAEKLRKNEARTDRAIRQIVGFGRIIARSKLEPDKKKAKLVSAITGLEELVNDVS